MRTALRRWNVVHIREDVFSVVVGVLHGQTDAHILLHAFQQDHTAIQRCFIPVDIAHIVGQSPLIMEHGFLLFRVFLPLIRKGDFKPSVEISQLAQAAADRIGIEFRFLKDGVIRQKSDTRSMAARCAHPLQGCHRTPRGNLLFLLVIPALKAHAVMAAACAAVHNQPFGKSIDHRGAHAVQAAGIIVILMVKLSARVQAGVDDLHARDAQLRMKIHRNSAPIILDGRAPILVQLNRDARGVSVGHLVNRIVYDLPQQVVQAAGAGRADIHARTHPDRIKPLKHLQHAGGIRFCHEINPPYNRTRIYYIENSPVWQPFQKISHHCRAHPDMERTDNRAWACAH